MPWKAVWRLVFVCVPLIDVSASEPIELPVVVGKYRCVWACAMLSAWSVCADGCVMTCAECPDGCVTTWLEGCVTTCAATAVPACERLSL